MKISLLDYLSGNVPGGIWLFVLFIVITWFILWFVYHFSGILAKKRLYSWGIGLSLLWTILYAFFWFSYPPPQDRQRVVFTFSAPTANSSSFIDLYTYEYLLYDLVKKQFANSDILLCHPDWVLQIGNWDSLKNGDYIHKIHQFMAADYSLHLQNLNGNQPDYWISLTAGKDTLLKQDVRFSPGSIKQTARLLCQNFAVQTQETETLSSPFLQIPWDSSAWRHFGAGRLALLQNKLNKANQYFKQCLNMNNDFYPAYLGLTKVALDSAIILKKNGGYFQEYLTLAHSFIYRFWDNNQSNAEILRLWGEYAILTENFVVAEQKLKQGFHINADDDLLYVDLSRLHPSRYRDLKFLNEESLFRIALFLNPASISARTGYSDYLHQHNRIDEAIHLYLDFLQKFPHQYELQMALGKYYISQQQYGAAEKLFHNMLQKSSENQDLIRFNLGITLFHQGDTLKAKQVFSQLAETGSNPDVYLYLAYIAEKQDDIDRAITFLRKRIRESRGLNDPYKEEARKHLILLLKKRGNEQE